MYGERAQPAQSIQMDAGNRFRYNVFWACLIFLILFALLLLAIAGVILGAFAVDWIHTGKIQKDGSCKFANDCYTGFKLHGKCFGRFPKDDGSKCETACYDVEEEPNRHECQFREYDLFGNLVEQSVCTGSNSVGECIITSNCPDITYEEFNTASSTKDCDSDACYYTLDLTGGENADIDAPCCCDSKVWEQVCYAKLNQTDPLVLDNCMAAQPICGNDTILGCMYFMRDARPTQIMIVKRQEMAREALLNKNDRNDPERQEQVDNNNNLEKLEDLFKQQQKLTGNNVQNRID